MIKNKIIYTNFSDWRFEVSRAEGSYIWDKKGRKLIDFTSGWNVTNLGWNQPEITEAIIKQAKKNTYVSMWSADPIQEEYAVELSKSLLKGLTAIGRATGGTEANEEAIKTARAYTKRKKILGFKDTYHGQSFGTLAIGYKKEYLPDVYPLVPGFVQLEFPNLYRTDKCGEELLTTFEKKLESVLSKRDIAAVITEAEIITGWGSTYVAPKGYLKTVRRVTKKYGTLLILDEVGTGFSRCGKLFGMQLENVTPDIATFAKGISNGAAAIGAMVTTKEIAEKTYPGTNLVSTFGWMPTACAAALRTLQIHKRDKVWLKAEKDGRYMLKTLGKELKDHPKVGDIRGKGMEIGIDFVKDKKTKKKDPEIIEKIVEKAFARGLHIVCDHDSNIQLMPPLTISRKNLNKGLEILVETINQFK